MVQICHRMSLLTAVSLAIALLTGCETTSRTLLGSEQVDIETFARATVGALGTEKLDFRGDQLTYLRAYIDDETESAQQLRENLRVVDRFQAEAILYSVELVRVVEENEADAARLNDLAEIVDQSIGRELRDYVDWTDEEYEQMLDQIRSSKSLLAGLRTLQPLINDAGKAYEEFIQQIEDGSLLAVRLEVDERIEADFALVKAFAAEQAKRRDRILKAMSLLTDHWRNGNEQALAELADLGVFWDSSNLPTIRSSDAELERAFNLLQKWYLDEQTIYDRLLLDIDSYLKTREELDAAEERIISALGVARIQFVSWTRGHQALANGVKNPGKWLEIAMEAAEVAAETAVKTVF